MFSMGPLPPAHRSGRPQRSAPMTYSPRTSASVRPWCFMAARIRSATSATGSSALISSTRRGPPNTWAPSSGRLDAHAKLNIASHDDLPRPPGATSNDTAPRTKSIPCSHCRLGGMLGRAAVHNARAEVGCGEAEEVWAAAWVPPTWDRARAGSRHCDRSRPARRAIASNVPTIIPLDLDLYEHQAVLKSASLVHDAP
jgi:hypothetical protein